MDNEIQTENTAPETTVNDEMKMAMEWALNLLNHGRHEAWQEALILLGICYRVNGPDWRPQKADFNCAAHAVDHSLRFFWSARVENPWVDREFLYGPKPKKRFVIGRGNVDIYEPGYRCEQCRAKGEHRICGLCCHLEDRLWLAEKHAEDNVPFE